MNNEEPIVEIMGITTDESGNYLSQLYDPGSHTYNFPQTTEMRFDPLLLVRNVREDAVAIAFLDSGMLAEHPVIRPRNSDTQSI